MLKYLLDDDGIVNAGNGFDLAAAGAGCLDIDIEYAF